MWIVALYFGFLILGFIVSSKKTSKGKEIKISDKAIPVLVFIIVFLLGIKIGSDDQVLASVGEIGAAAVVVTIFAMAGSVLAVTLLRKLLKIDKRGLRRNE